MKLSNLLVLILLTFTAATVHGQSIKDFRKDIKDIKKAVDLSERQTEKVTAVYQKIVDDLIQLKSMNYSDEEYRKKRRSVYHGAEFSLAQIIREDQKASYDLYKRSLREQRAKKLNKLRKQKASNDDLMDAEIGVKQI